MTWSGTQKSKSTFKPKLNETAKRLPWMLRMPGTGDRAGVNGPCSLGIGYWVLPGAGLAGKLLESKRRLSSGLCPQGRTTSKAGLSGKTLKPILMSKRLAVHGKDWYVARIGKRVFRLRGLNECDCQECRTSRSNGLIIDDEQTAGYRSCNFGTTNRARLDALSGARNQGLRGLV